jgi:ferredoxin
MPKPRVLEKYDVDESRCILCGICVDACPYDALRCGPDFELSHESRADPMIDLMAISAMDRDTELTYVRRERDWAVRAADAGRGLPEGRFLPMLPPGAVAAAAAAAGAAPNQSMSANGHGNGTGYAGNGVGGGGTHVHAK